MCDALQQIKEEGREEGIAIGEKKGIQKVAVELLKGNHPIPFIADVTKLSVRFLYKGIIIKHNKNRANLHENVAVSL